MLRAGLFTVAVLLALPAFPATVHNSNGGILMRFIMQRNEWDRHGDLIRISGYCLSSCTVYLSAWRYCVAPNTKLGFHRVSSQKGSRNEALTRWLYSQYPFAVRAWIARMGGLQKNIVILSGRDLRRAVRICS